MEIKTKDTRTQSEVISMGKQIHKQATIKEINQYPELIELKAEPNTRIWLNPEEIKMIYDRLKEIKQKQTN